MGCRITVSGGQDFSAVGVSSKSGHGEIAGKLQPPLLRPPTLTPDAISSLLATIRRRSILEIENLFGSDAPGLKGEVPLFGEFRSALESRLFSTRPD